MIRQASCLGGVRPEKLIKKGRPDGPEEVRLADITQRSGEPITWGKRPVEIESFWGDIGSIQRENTAFCAKRREDIYGNGT